jgi:glycosyltransferase involved in cell wall biosynthesis
MITRPLVSIIIPCRNAQETLFSSIQSILQQDYVDLELIIVNDNSTDSSCTIARQFAERDNRIKLVNNQTGTGIPDTRNLGIKKASGDFIAWLDADDIAVPSRIGKQVCFLEEHPDIDVVGSFAIIVKNHDFVGNRGLSPLVSVSRFTEHAHICCDALFRLPVLTPTSMIRAKKIKNMNKPYNEKFPICSDYDLLVRMINVWRFANIPEPLVHIRVNSTANTTQRNRLLAKQADMTIQSRLLQSIGIGVTNDTRSLHMDLCMANEAIEQRWSKAKMSLEETHLQWLTSISSYNARNTFFDIFALQDRIDDLLFQHGLPKGQYNPFTKKEVQYANQASTR